MLTSQNIKKFTTRQILIGGAINSALSLVFFFLLFRGVGQIQLGAGSKFALDFLPQALFVGFFSALPPTLLAMKTFGKTAGSNVASNMTGSFDGKDLDWGSAVAMAPLMNAVKLPLSVLPKALPLRIAVLTALSVIVFGGLAVAITSLLGAVSINFVVGALLKVFFALFVTATITPVAVGGFLASRG